METFKEFLTESDGVKYSSTQINLPEDLANKIIVWARRNIDPMDIDPKDGLEDQIHCTALYGIHTENPQPVRTAIEGFGGVELEIGKTSMFPGEDSDVLKLSVKSRDIHRLHAVLKKNLKSTENFDRYIPHITIGYLKPGEGKKYINKSVFEGKICRTNVMQFSTPNPGRIIYNLRLV